MDRPHKFSLLFAAMAMAMAGLLALACDSGTQEPDAPASVEESTGAAASAAAGGGLTASRYPKLAAWFAEVSELPPMKATAPVA